MNDKSVSRTKITSIPATGSSVDEMATENVDKLANELLYVTLEMATVNNDKYANVQRYVTMETINDDCLYLIFQHLSIVEAANFAATCTKLHNFARDFIFPKKAKHIRIELNEKCDNTGTMESPKGLESAFGYFGEFVEKLFIRNNTPNLLTAECLRVMENVLKLCTKLDKLILSEFNGIDFGIIKNVTCLKVLKIRWCYKITDTSLDALRYLTHLKQLHLSGTSETGTLTDDFLEHNTSLSGLTIDFEYGTEEFLAKIFENNGHRIRTLKLINFSKSSYFQSIGTLILDKVPNLERLAISDVIKGSLDDSIGELKHLKSLNLRLHLNQGISSLMRKLSERGIIEEICFIHGVFDDETNDAPLIFSQLRRFRLGYYTIKYSMPKMCIPLLKALTRSQMPQIQSFSLTFFIDEYDVFDELLALFESKRTLKKMEITSVKNGRKTFGMVRSMIEILKAYGTPIRPYFNLDLHPLQLEAEEV